jgi:hypothetical protein
MRRSAKELKEILEAAIEIGEASTKENIRLLVIIKKAIRALQANDMSGALKILEETVLNDPDDEPGNGSSH